VKYVKFCRVLWGGTQQTTLARKIRVFARSTRAKSRKNLYLRCPIICWLLLIFFDDTAMTHSSATAPALASAHQSSARLLFIDLLRGIACVWMIQTHVTNACMSWGYREGWAFNLLNTTNGYVSVTFIFCAGAGFWLAATRKADEYRQFAPSLWHYVRRLGFILLVAYWLHIPEFSLQKLLISPPERQNILFICDVLHAIVMSSFLALALLMLVPSLRVLRWLFVGFALTFFFGAPFVWLLEPDTFLPRVLGAYLSRPPAAAFPLFPWCGYFFTGAAVTAFFTASPNKRRFAYVLIVVGLVLPAVTLFIQLFSPFAWVLNYGWGQNWYLCSPGNALFRVGGTMLLYGILFLVQDQTAESRVGRWLRLLGQESLFVYVFHLMIVYGSPVNLGLGYFTGNSFKPIAVLIVTTAIVIAVYIATDLWHNFKRNEPRKQQRFLWAFGGLFATIFLITTPAFVDWSKAKIEELFPAIAQQQQPQ